MEQGAEAAGPCPKCLLAAALGPESSLQGQEAPHRVPSPREGGEGEPEWSTPGTLLASRYTVLNTLGQGGMGVVLAAYDARLDRRVALKLLRPGRASGNVELEMRLFREAQAMARLNHPHVVQVYDSGHLEDGSLFIAMEYVEGQTLRDWCEAQPRSWREVLDAYLAAGRGLAAAHEAGLVHRDFKPDNVLVGQDGRVRVLDFGLARLTAAPRPEPQRLETPTPGALSGSLTRSDWLLGTPLYMAPELLRGAPADVRSDLFAFCVSLHESLHGRPPFLEEESSGRIVLDKKLAPPPEGSAVPEWVTRTVYRGLPADPAQRPASLGGLLAALEDDPERKRRTRRQVMPLALGALLLLPLALWGWWRSREPGCEFQGERLAGVWDGEVKGQVAQALVGTGLPYARDSFERVSRGLDDYARTWVGMRTEVCEEVREQPGVPGGLLLLEEQCLERRLGQLRTFTELLAQGPDAALLSRAVQAVQSLPPLESCQGEGVLAAEGALPDNPQLRVKVRELRGELDRLEVLHLAGKSQEGLALYEELWPRVEPVEHVPLHAHALWWHARLLEAAGRYPQAEESAERALELSIRGGNATQIAQAWTAVALLKGVRQSRYQLPEVLLLDKTLESVAELSRNDLVRVTSLNVRGSVLLGQARYEEARERLEHALTLAEAALGPEHPLVQAVLNNLGLVYKGLGRYADARRCYERSLESRRKVFGQEHPEVAQSLSNLGALLSSEGRYEEASVWQAQALAMMERVLGPEHPSLALMLNSLANTLYARGRYEEARARFEQVRERLEKQHGKDSSMGTIVHLNLCSTLVDLGRYEEARVKCERARALGGQRMPTYLLALTHHALGQVSAGQGRHEEARKEYERSLALLEEALGPKHPECMRPLMGLTELHLTRGRPLQALALLERAREIASPEWREEVRFPLARALWDSGRERTRARELATEALRHYEGLGHPKRDEVARWLAAHSLP